MADIDLIPAEFRQMLARIRDVKIVCALTVAMVLAGFGAGSVMQHSAQRLAAERDSLAQRHALSEQQGDELTNLSNARDRLLSQRETLDRLRGGSVVTELMSAMDNALLDDSVWFLDWSFRRAGADSDDDETQTNGYFIVANDEKGMNVKTHMSISGQAMDHAALSKFVRELFNQPQVQDVRVKQTTVRRYPTHSIVDFEVAVILQSKVG